MKAVPQYTIRNMPEPVDRYLRRQARRSGKSLNQTIISELSERAGVTKDGKPTSLLESLSWFIGSGMDQDVIDALEEEDKIQKQLAVRELEAFQKEQSE
jgi:hypothetical protein